MIAILFGWEISNIAPYPSFLFGAWDAPLIALLIFIALDLTSLVFTVIIRREIPSSFGWAGLLKKGLILVVIIVAVLLDRLLNTQWTIRSAACYFYIAHESISILENAASIGMPIPKTLAAVLKQLGEEEASISGGNENKDKKDSDDTKN